ncbi:TetR/AcrR family transcriptional regulator [Oceanobacter mangrovi]|uniref:TetR/AcrR family transcriptional regulator n=1 Tax=Oceanobacter mangrovi TaxID=2862510 RepID=UPI001C8DFC8C|nr:TetR/AcrR family transcriptional regulator [Oceanobacter mangrovi]
MKTKSEARRLHIVEVATEVFRESGFERTSMAEISARVGGSKATLYNYFSSKEKLFLEVMVSSNQQQFDAAQALLDFSDATFKQALQQFGVALLKLLFSPDVLSVRRLVIAEALRSDLGHDCYRRSRKLGEQRISERLQLAIDKGILKTVDANRMTTHLLGLLESEFTEWLVWRDAPELTEPQLQAAVERAVDVFWMAYGKQSD